MGKSEAIEQMFKLGDKPLVLYQYQKKWIEDESQFRIVNKSRQTGFSFVCAMEALMKAMFVPRSVILFISTGERGALRLMKYVTDAWYSIPNVIRDKFELTSLSKQELSFKHNGSQIISLPNNPATVRGYPATDIYIDEFAFFEKEDIMWTAIMPSIVRKELKRRVSIISTPNGKLNTFFKLYETVKGTPDDVWSRHFVHWTDCPDLNAEELKKTMGEVQFRQEFCGEFVDEATAVIPLELIMSCVDMSLINMERLDGDRATYVGIDFGKKRDSTVAVFFEKVYSKDDEDYTFVMRRMDMYLEDYTTQIPKINNKLRQLHAMHVWLDQTGVGEKLYEDMKRGDRKWSINGIIFSRQWKERAVTDMIQLMQDKKVKFINNDELIKQMHGLQRKVTQHNNVRFEHDNGEHDDIFWAIALALSKASHQKGFFGLQGSHALM